MKSLKDCWSNIFFCCKKNHIFSENFIFFLEVNPMSKFPPNSSIYKSHIPDSSISKSSIPNSSMSNTEEYIIFDTSSQKSFSLIIIEENIKSNIWNKKLSSKPLKKFIFSTKIKEDIFRNYQNRAYIMHFNQKFNKDKKYHANLKDSFDIIVEYSNSKHLISWERLHQQIIDEENLKHFLQIVKKFSQNKKLLSRKNNNDRNNSISNHGRNYELSHDKNISVNQLNISVNQSNLIKIMNDGSHKEISPNLYTFQGDESEISYSNLLKNQKDFKNKLGNKNHIGQKLHLNNDESQEDPLFFKNSQDPSIHHEIPLKKLKNINRKKKIKRQEVINSQNYNYQPSSENIINETIKKQPMDNTYFIRNNNFDHSIYNDCSDNYVNNLVQLKEKEVNFNKKLNEMVKNKKDNQDKPYQKVSPMNHQAMEMPMKKKII
jgi:hypothetical protein